MKGCTKRLMIMMEIIICTWPENVTSEWTPNSLQVREDWTSTGTDGLQTTTRHHKTASPPSLMCNMNELRHWRKYCKYSNFHFTSAQQRPHCWMFTCGSLKLSSFCSCWYRNSVRLLGVLVTRWRQQSSVTAAFNNYTSLTDKTSHVLFFVQTNWDLLSYSTNHLLTNHLLWLKRIQDF